jgi:hypothetical protein
MSRVVGAFEPVGTTRLRSLLIGSLSALAGMLAFAAPSSAAEIAVDPGAVVIAPDGSCSINEAVQNANADAAANADCAAGSGADTLTLGAGSTYTLLAATSTYYGFTGLPQITSEIAIDGNGATLTRDGAAPPFRLIAVADGGSLSIRELTLSNGLAKGGDGGDDVGGDDGGGGGGGAGLGGLWR